MCSSDLFSAESWLEAAGAVAAEREVIELLARQAGMPDTASGCFMSGGSIGNLSALAVARDQAGDRRTVVVADTFSPGTTSGVAVKGKYTSTREPKRIKPYRCPLCSVSPDCT